MEADLCLPTRHFPAMRHHKTVLVHSSIRLPALQAEVGPPPGAARVAVVGAGVVLACALGPMYWKRMMGSLHKVLARDNMKQPIDPFFHVANKAHALQLPMHRSSQTSHVGGNGSAGGHQASGIVSIKELHELLSEICIRKTEPKPPQVTELIHQCLAQKDVKNVSKSQDLTSLLEEKFPKTNIGKHDYNLSIVLILALISENKYAKAKEICNKLIPVAIPSDARPHLLLAIINMMMAMESMLQFPNETSTVDLKKNLEEVEKAWEHYLQNN